MNGVYLKIYNFLIFSPFILQQNVKILSLFDCIPFRMCRMGQQPQGKIRDERISQGVELCTPAFSGFRSLYASRFLNCHDIVAQLSPLVNCFSCQDCQFGSFCKKEICLSAFLSKRTVGTSPLLVRVGGARIFASQKSYLSWLLLRNIHRCAMGGRAIPMKGTGARSYGVFADLSQSPEK